MVYNPEKPYKNQILKLIKRTWNTPYISIREGIYPSFKKNFNYPEIDHTDGIGTKGIYHWQKRTFKNAVIDALAMNLNDLALVGAVPYKIQSHIIIPKDDRKAILKIIKTLVAECRKRKIAITGGETSIHNNIKGMDISLTVSGLIRETKENQFKASDILIGIKSNGLHSNGFTKVRKIFGKEYSPEFVRPTAIYLETILNLRKNYKINGMMHITGGAFTKLEGLIKGCDIYITRNHKLKPHNIFREIHKRGVSDEEMYKTFNCGIGFIFSVSPRDANRIIAKLSNSDVIGKVVLGMGKIKIESLFSDKTVNF